MEKKNQISKYHTASPKKYNEKDIRLINKRLLKPLGVLRKKIKRSIKYDW